MALSDLTVRKATATGKDRSIADFDGLYLFVPVQGRKAWHFRYYYVGKRERFSLGTYPEVSLREARDLRDEARALLAKGINPRNERKRKRQAIVLAGADTLSRHPLYEALFTATARVLDAPITDIDVAFSLSNPDELYTLLSEAGFQSIEITPRSLSIRMPEPERFVQLSILGAATESARVC